MDQSQNAVQHDPGSVGHQFSYACNCGDCLYRKKHPQLFDRQDATEPATLPGDHVAHTPRTPREDAVAMDALGDAVATAGSITESKPA